MSFSANELASLAHKAAVGAGFPPSQAETFGRAATLYLGDGHGAEALVGVLDDAADSPVLRLPLLMDDILRAIALLGPEVTLSLHPGDVDLASSYARLLPLQITSLDVDIPEEGQPRMHLVTDPARPTQHPLPPRITAPEPLVSTWQDLAARTYVPATAASRAGAGAGNIDND